MSEAYSEAPDHEGARLLLDFGDDYRNFFDSQSDCASSMSAVRGNSPPPQKTRQRRVSLLYPTTMHLILLFGKKK